MEGKDGIKHDDRHGPVGGHKFGLEKKKKKKKKKKEEEEDHSLTQRARVSVREDEDSNRRVGSVVSIRLMLPRAVQLHARHEASNRRSGTLLA